MKEAVLWIGPPFSGKDSQTDRIEAMGIPVFSTGNLARKLASQSGNSAVSNDMMSGKLINSDVVFHQTQIWIIRNLGAPMIHLNGMPRAIDQAHIIQFLRRMGFTPIVIWFDTSVEECLRRPGRPGREAEDSRESRMRRLQVYYDKTAPLLGHLDTEYGISPANKNMFRIDNSNIPKDETTRRITNFLNLSRWPTFVSKHPPIGEQVETSTQPQLQMA